MVEYHTEARANLPGTGGWVNMWMEHRLIGTTTVKAESKNVTEPVDAVRVYTVIQFRNIYSQK
jgi:hypothetical protein